MQAMAFCLLTSQSKHHSNQLSLILTVITNRHNKISTHFYSFLQKRHLTHFEYFRLDKKDFEEQVFQIYCGTFHTRRANHIVPCSPI